MVHGGVKRARKWQRSQVKTLCWDEQKQSELVNEMTGIFSVGQRK